MDEVNVNKVNRLIEKYIRILKERGDPDERYKYSAIDTFQKNWNLEAEDFDRMFRNSFKKRSNLLFQNSWGFMEKATRLFPDKVREMFRDLYDEPTDLTERIERFQSESKKLLPQVKQALNRTNLGDQQDERTISVYLAFRHPEKYILYKADYYKKFSELLNIKPRKTGERFLHLQELADQIIAQDLLEEQNFQKIYRDFYPKPDWDDKYLMLQNVLYVNYNKPELERMAFDKEFRNEILSQLEDDLVAGEQPKITDRQKYPLNQILFGAPGTGKTYDTKRIAVEIINGVKPRTREEINEEYQELVNTKQIVFTTFHQSLSYEDFIEGIKPETADGQVVYEVRNGIFKEICLNASPQNTIGFENAYEKLKQELVKNNELELTTPTNKKFSIALNKNGNLTLMTGSKREKQGVLTRDNLLRQLSGEEVFTGWEGYFKGVINYLRSEFNFNPEATEKPKNYVLIIDEINRGNVSAIFGELITLLEEDKRNGNEEETEVTLTYSNDKFSVPNNVYIIGTMNTADRSVEALDTALRRRFSFTEMQPDPDVLADLPYKEVDLKKLLETINRRIEMLINKDHQIGHSYFLGIENTEDLKCTFKDKIIPLLEEYFYGDFGKIGLVLGGEFIYRKESKENFAKNFIYENDFLEDKKVYRFTPFDTWNENTFISVYED